MRSPESRSSVGARLAVTNSSLADVTLDGALLHNARHAVGCIERRHSQQCRSSVSIVNRSDVDANQAHTVVSGVAESGSVEPSTPTAFQGCFSSPQSLAAAVVLDAFSLPTSTSRLDWFLAAMLAGLLVLAYAPGSPTRARERSGGTTGLR